MCLFNFNLMKTKITFRIVLSLLLLTYTASLSFGQSNTFGTVKGKITKNKSGLAYSKVKVYAKIGNEITAETVSDENGQYELSLPSGFHNIYTSSIYSTTTKTISVDPGNTIEWDVVLPLNCEEPTWESSEAYPELSGQWNALTYTKWGQTSDVKEQVNLYFSFLKNDLPGQIGWTDGCRTCGNLTYGHHNPGMMYFRHIGNGVIELNKDAVVYCNMSDCPTKNPKIGSFIHNMMGKQTKSVVSEDGQTLELSRGGEKFVFRKVLENNPEFSTE